MTGPSSPAWPSGQSRDLSPNASGGLTPLSPPSELQEIPVAIREQSGVLRFHSRAIPSFPSQLEWKIGLAWANTRGSLNSPSELENPAVTREKPRGSPVIARPCSFGGTM